MSEFLKSNKALDEVIRNSTSVAEMREAMLTTLAAQGVVVRDRQDAYDVRLTSSQQPAPSPPAASAEPVDHNRVSRFIYPVNHGNDRYEIFGADEAELAEKERQIRALLD